MEAMREWLYYPIGLLPPLFFTLRFLIQWLQSERKQESHVTGIFWKLSLTGNVLLLLHYTIQVQFPFAMIQAGNGVIAWRNLNLMGKSEKRCLFGTVVGMLCLALTAVTAIFVMQGYLHEMESVWFRLPTFVGKSEPHLEAKRSLPKQPPDCIPAKNTGHATRDV